MQDTEESGPGTLKASPGKVETRIVRQMLDHRRQQPDHV